MSRKTMTLNEIKTLKRVVDAANTPPSVYDSQAEFAFEQAFSPAMASKLISYVLETNDRVRKLNKLYHEYDKSIPIEEIKEIFS